MTTTRPWFCTRTDCPAPSHDTASARRYGCDSGAARRAKYRYDSRYRAGAHTPQHLDPIGLRRRIEAAHLWGWSSTAIASELGIRYQYLNKTLNGERKTILRTTFDHWAPILERLAMEPAPPSMARRRTQNWAAKRGFRPLLTWVDIDDPDEQPPTETPDEPPTLRAVDDLDLDALYVAVRERRRPLGELDARARSYAVERAWRVRLEEGYTTRELLYAVAELLNADPMLVSRTHASAVTRRNRALKEAS